MASLKNRRVDPNLYDKKYYESVCTGYNLFSESDNFGLRSDLLKAKKLSKISKKDKILDIGCGRGEFLFHIYHEYRCKITGIDYAAESVKISKKLFTKKKIPSLIRQADAKKLPFKDNSFDKVFMLDIVEHLYPEELDKALSEAVRVLKKTGTLVIHTKPNKNYFDIGYSITRNIKRIIYPLANTISNKYPIPPKDPRPEHDKIYHVYEQTNKSLRKHLRKLPITFKIVNEHFTKITWKNFLLKFITEFYPFSKYWPLKNYFSHNIYAIVKK